MYKYVFIDLDHTIWDFHVNAKSTLHEIYEQRKLYRYFENFEQYFTIYDKRNLELWELYGKGEITKDNLSYQRFLHPLTQVGLHDENLALQIGTEYLELLPTRTALIPFAKELLEYLYKKYPLTIVSNGFIEVQYRKIKSCQIEQYFNHIVLSEEANALKPDKQIFEYALQLNNARAEETIMIGDSYEVDIVGAQNANIDQIYFNPNMSEADNALKCSFRIEKLSEILQIL